MSQTKKIAERLFGDAHTIERREFADGDKRTEIIHSVGWSATEYVKVRIWVGRSEVWVEYYEGDVRRAREILDYHDDYDADDDPMEYIW